MVKVYKLHKFFGLSAGLLILLLGFTGFFLDHDKWSFLYTTTFKIPHSIAQENDKRLFNSYFIDSKNPSHIILSSHRGIYESFDDSKSFKKTLDIQSLSIRKYKDRMFAATAKGLYRYENGDWKYFALSGEYINALAISKDKIVASIDKEELVILDKNTAKVLSRTSVNIDKNLLQEDIKLSRFVRDLHYGRGLFDGDISLFINDYGAIIMAFLPLSGFLIWWFIRRKIYPTSTRKLIHYHANIFIIVAFIPIVIVAITGVFLDHSKGLAKFMSSVTIPHTILPPVYSTLASDIWSVDIENSKVFIGNRFGVYSSEDLKKWDLESKGFAYSMMRKDKNLYVAGMGAANKIYNGEWNYLQGAPHMFRNVVEVKNEVKYFSPHNDTFELPIFEEITLYSILLTLHDSRFFASWWVWVNDFIAFAVVLLGITGSYRWYKKKKRA